MGEPHVRLPPGAGDGLLGESEATEQPVPIEGNGPGAQDEIVVGDDEGADHHEHCPCKALHDRDERPVRLKTLRKTAGPTAESRKGTPSPAESETRRELLQVLGGQFGHQCEDEPLVRPEYRPGITPGVDMTDVDPHAGAREGYPAGPLQLVEGHRVILW